MECESKGLDGILDRAERGNCVMLQETLVLYREWQASVMANDTMEDIITRESVPGAPSIARCRELLDDEALELSDEEIDVIRRHAHAMAHLLVEIFMESSPRA